MSAPAFNPHTPRHSKEKSRCAGRPRAVATSGAAEEQLTARARRSSPGLRGRPARALATAVGNGMGWDVLLPFTFPGEVDIVPPGRDRAMCAGNTQESRSLRTTSPKGPG